MTHLRIEQNNGVIEEVSSSIITKLYEIAHAGLDMSSNLLGRLHTPVAYRYEVLYLTEHFPDLFITLDDYAIPFEDPNMVTYLNSIGVGSGGFVTESQASAATIVANSVNTTVTKFNELKYFTNITQSKGGWTGTNAGYTRFFLWTALEEVDISNFTSLGHVGGAAYSDTFRGCTSLKTVTASDKLTKIGYCAFMGCTNLEHITGLSGTILVSSSAFANCSKLPDEDIADIEFEPAYEGTSLKGNNAFEGTNFTEITLSPNTTKIPSKMFYNCSNLETVNGLGSNITEYNDYCFVGCTKFTGPIDFTNVTHIGSSAFTGSGLTGVVDLQHILTIDSSNNFNGTKITSVNYHGNTISGFSGLFNECKNLITASGMLNILAPCGSMFSGCTSLTSVDFNWNNVTNHTVPEGIFKDCSSLLSIDLTGATTINEGAFLRCSNLTTITGTSGITSIGKNVFNGCTNLASTFDFANTVTVQESAFKGCKYCTFTNLDKVSNFGMTAFSDANIPTSVLFKDGVSIGMQSFENSNVLSIEFLGGGTIGHKGILKAKSLQSIVFNADIAFGANCFQECTSLQSVDLSNISELSLFYNAGYGIGSQFASCSALSSVTLNPNITKLPKGMFSYCGSSNLELTIPAGVTEIGENFLYGTNGVKLTVLATTPPTLANLNALGGMTYIKVPAGTLSAYQSAQYWSNKASVMSELPS